MSTTTVAVHPPLADRHVAWRYVSNISRTLFRESTTSQDPQRALQLVILLWKWLPSAGAVLPPKKVNTGGLSDRLVSVLVGISEGKSNEEIGRTLFVSENTIKSHVGAILKKLQAHDRAHAVALGFRHGILS